MSFNDSIDNNNVFCNYNLKSTSQIYLLNDSHYQVSQSTAPMIHSCLYYSEYQNYLFYTIVIIYNVYAARLCYFICKPSFHLKPLF